MIFSDTDPWKMSNRSWYEINQFTYFEYERFFSREKDLQLASQASRYRDKAADNIFRNLN